MPSRVTGKGTFHQGGLISQFEIPLGNFTTPSQVANILLAHAGRGGSRGVAEAAAEIARTAARSWLAPLLDTACDRLAFVLCNLFDIAIERNRHLHAGCKF